MKLQKSHAAARRYQELNGGGSKEDKLSIRKPAAEMAKTLIKRDRELVKHETRTRRRAGNSRSLRWQFGAKLMKAQKKYDDETALHVAARAGRPKIMRFLLENEANENWSK